MHNCRYFLGFNALSQFHAMSWQSEVSRNGGRPQGNLPKSCKYFLAIRQWTHKIFRHAWSTVYATYQWAFWAPHDQGKYPDDIPANVSAQQCSELLICHKAAKQVYDTFKAVIQCLHNQFQKIIHKDYLAILDNPDAGLTNIQPSIIYQHIIDWYAKLDLKMVEKEWKSFNVPMDLTKPLAAYRTKQ